MTETDSSALEEMLAKLGEVSGEIHELDSDRDAILKAARHAGATWVQIGEAMGISKQSAWERFRRIDSDGPGV